MLLAHRGVWLIPPMIAPAGAWALEITALEISEVPGGCTMPILELMGGSWRRNPRALQDGPSGTVLVVLEELPSDADAPRVEVRLLHHDGDRLRFVGVWPDMGVEWPEVIAPTVQLLARA